MARSAGTILLAVALLTANAAWCESDPPLTAVTIASFEEGYKSQSVLVRETEVGIWYAVAAGVRMALTREPFNSVWPSYAYKIDPASNNLDRACQLLEHGMPEHFADDAMILRSQVELGAQASVEFMGYELKALDVCSSSAPNSIWPSYAYEIDSALNNPVSTCQLLERGIREHFTDDAMILRSPIELGSPVSGIEFMGYERNALDVCSSGAEIYNYNYLVTETPVPLPSLELNAWFWREKSGIYNYLVTETPVPSLELGARVWREKSNYVVKEALMPSPENEQDGINHYIVQFVESLS